MTAHIPAQGGFPESQYGENFGLASISTRFEDHDAREANANENDPADRPNLPNMPDSGSSAGHLPPSDKKAEVNAKDANLRNVFENTMRDLGTIGKPHRKTAVLMVSWAEELDDLNTAQEVNDLESVFKEDFHYTVVKEQLAGDKPPAHQFSKFLSDFVLNYDSESTLLIIYYAGHGTPGKKGELHFTGKKLPKQKRTIRNSIPWHSTEHILKCALGHVLLIFDCCYAGNLAPSLDRRSYWPARSFEFLAACGSGEETHMPGDKSFTRALIWSLKELAKARSRFTTLELQQKISNEAPNFPRQQFVPLLERAEPSDQRLVLAPLPSATEGSDPDVTLQDNSLAPRMKNYVDLRFCYSKTLNEDEIGALAKNLKSIIVEEKIGANRIGWIRLGHVETVTRDVVNAFRHLAQNSSSRRMALTSPGLDMAVEIPQSHHLQPSAHQRHPSSPSNSARTSVSDFQLGSSEAGPPSSFTTAGDLEMDFEKRPAWDDDLGDSHQQSELNGGIDGQQGAVPSSKGELSLIENFKMIAHGTKGVVWVAAQVWHPTMASTIAILSLCAASSYYFSFHFTRRSN